MGAGFRPPLWARDFGRHPAEGLTQRFFDLVTDNDLNRLVLRGVEAAAEMLSKTEAGAAAGRELFSWRGIASSVATGPDAYAQAHRSLDSLTEHYRLPLTLSRALVVGDAPEDVLSGTDGALQTLDFDLATLFERLLHKLVRAVAGPLGLTVVAQAKDRRALLDATGALYREVRPDLVVYRGDIPVGVIDAKFKPRYVEGAEGEMVPKASRASNADVYQLFFYQARLQARYSLPKAPPAVIVAPLEREGGTWDPERRTVVWPGAPEDGRLEILPISLPRLLTAIDSGADPVDALAASGDLSALLERWAA